MKGGRASHLGWVEKNGTCGAAGISGGMEQAESAKRLKRELWTCFNVHSHVNVQRLISQTKGKLRVLRWHELGQAARNRQRIRCRDGRENRHAPCGVHNLQAVGNARRKLLEIFDKAL